MSDTWMNESAHFNVYAFKDGPASTEIKIMFEITCQSDDGRPPLVLEFPVSEANWRKYKAAVDRGIYELRSAKGEA